MAWKRNNRKRYRQGHRKTIVTVNPEFFRPAEVEVLLGDPSKAEEKLGWKREITFQELVKAHG